MCWGRDDIAQSGESDSENYQLFWVSDKLEQDCHCAFIVCVIWTK